MRRRAKLDPVSLAHVIQEIEAVARWAKRMGFAAVHSRLLVVAQVLAKAEL